LTLNLGTTQSHTGNLSGGTSMQLVKSGAGTQILGGSNTYSGDTIINAGSLQINTAGAIGGTNITVSGTGNSALVLNDALVAGSGKSLTISGGGVGGFFGALTNVTGATGVSEWQGDLTIGDATGTRVGAQGGILRISGNINDTGAGRQLVVRNSNGGKTIFAGTNTYTGETLINTSGGELHIEGGSAIHDAGLVNIVNSAGNIFRIAGSETIGALTGGGANGKVALEADQTLTLSNGTQVFAGVIEGSGALEVNGAVQTLTGINTYTGDTTVSSGTLTVSGTGSLAAGSSVTVEDLATLSVAGSIHGSLMIADGGTLTGNGGTFNSSVTINGIHSPGSSPGLQTFASGLSYGSTATLNAEFVGDDLGIRGTDYDAINVTGGDLLIDFSSVFKLIGSSIDYSGSVWDSDRSFTIIDFAGGGTSSGIFSLDTSLAGSFAGEGSWALANTSGDVVLGWTAVPEPASALLGGIGLLLLLRRRRN
jgi:autotransporter-associated beta strand protein